MQLLGLQEAAELLAEKFAGMLWYEETDETDGDLRARDPRPGFDPIELEGGFVLYPRILFTESVQTYFAGNLRDWLAKRGITPARETWRGRRMMNVLNNADTSLGGVLMARVLCPAELKSWARRIVEPVRFVCGEQMSRDGFHRSHNIHIAPIDPGAFLVFNVVA